MLQGSMPCAPGPFENSKTCFSRTFGQGLGLKHFAHKRVYVGVL